MDISKITKTKQLAPVVVFCYNRPDHLTKTLEALSKNDLASESTLFIYCDGPKPDASEEQLKKISGTRTVAKSRQWCKEVHVIESDHNKGLADNIVGAVTEIVNRYGRIITLEDDIVTSKGFLRYMNDALEVYKDEDKVMHISGYMYPHKCKLPDTFFYPVPYPGGGWATWARAWKYFNNNTQELYDYWKNDWKKFNTIGGTFLQSQLEANLNGTLKTWFIKWHAVLLQKSAFTLFPGISLTNNIGFDSEATNCYVTTKFDVVPVDNIPVEIKVVKGNKKASRIIFDFYQGHWYNSRRRLGFANKILRFFHLPTFTI